MQKTRILCITEWGTGDNSGLTEVGDMVRCIYMGIIRRITRREGTTQINLPAEVREAIGAEIGDYLWIEVWDNQKVMMRKIDVLNNPSLRQLLPVGDPLKYDEPRD